MAPVILPHRIHSWRLISTTAGHSTPKKPGAVILPVYLPNKYICDSRISSHPVFHENPPRCRPSNTTTLTT